MTDLLDDPQRGPLTPVPAEPLAPLPPLREPPARRTLDAGRVVRVVAIALVVAGVTNSKAFVKAGEGMDDGWLRSATLAVARPTDDVATFLRFDQPRRWVDDLRGRTPDPGDATDPGPVAQPSAGPGPSSSTSPGPEPSEPPQAVALRDATASEPLRLLITGDSMIEFMAGKLTNLGDDKGALKTVTQVKYGTGLVRPDFFNWQAHAPKVVADQDPEAVLVMMGGNDGQNIQLPGRILTAGTPEWQAEYQRRAAGVMAALSAGGRRVYWVGMPIPKSAKVRPRFQSANTALAAAAAANSNVRYVDIWSLYAKDGAYSAVLPDASGRPVTMRAGDGIHLSRDGAQKLAAYLLPIVDADWHLLD